MDKVKGGCTAIVAAAGSSRRNGGKDKLFAPLGGKSVLCRTLCALCSAPSVTEFVIVTKPQSLSAVQEICQSCLDRPFTVICGGDTRARSVRCGLEAAGSALVCIHDGARPFVRAEDIEAVISRAASCGAATLAVPARDTLKEVEDGCILHTPDRSRIYHAQTPQVFDRALLMRGYDLLLSRGEVPTDDCSAAEAAGARVCIVEGHPDNIKMTTPEDFALARGLLGLPVVRTGHGYDVHRLTEGRRLILGGVDIPFEKGLLGHSDADVLAHAAADALLGALALGDIGRHFPDTDPAYKGADSLQLLARVSELVKEAGYGLLNLDCTVLCQRPKLAPHIDTMRKNLSAALGCELQAVSVKATTEEGLGFTGAGEGIAVHAVCLLGCL